MLFTEEGRFAAWCNHLFGNKLCSNDERDSRTKEAKPTRCLDPAGDGIAEQQDANSERHERVEGRHDALRRSQTNGRHSHSIPGEVEGGGDSSTREQTILRRERIVV